MAGTIHRRDITFAYFRDLHRFKVALMKLGPTGVRSVGEQRLLLPTWKHGDSGTYFFDCLKRYPREVNWFPLRDFRRVCHYGGISAGRMLHVLFAMSMLAVLESDGSRFRAQFHVPPDGHRGALSEGPAYLIERRRLTGLFTRNSLTRPSNEGGGENL